MYRDNLPKNYFDDLTDKIIQESLNIDDNIKEEAPLLFKVKKEELYSVPVSYFEDLDPIKISGRNKKTINLYQAWAIAASLLLLVSIYWWPAPSFDTSDSFAELESSNFINYLLENEDDIETDIILELEELYLLETDISMEEISDIDLENYLEKNIDDLTLNDLSILEN